MGVPASGRPLLFIRKRLSALVNASKRIVSQEFYGMREFIIRDCNGFWITFGQPAFTTI